MMNMETALEEKMDLIAKTIRDIKPEGIIRNDQEFMILIAKTYEIILPPVAKIFVKPDAFINACMTKKEHILKSVNKIEMKSRFKIV